MSEDKDREETMTVSGEWAIGAYTYKAGNYLDEFVEGLQEEKLIGTLCTNCGTVYVRPRYVCGRCMKKVEERTEVSDRGTVVSYSITEPVEAGEDVFGMDPIAMGFVEEGEQIILVCVNFDGASGTLVNLILYDAEPEDVYPGMRVKALWEDEKSGEMSDFKGVVPIENKKLE